ncbi:F-box protein SKIP23-like [Mercurialis annua]|uniref:F-box protein SKIP23-like n=1 Tax=Mercurialis annua TaxID=3986 RepID=UPI00215F8944|nr:F-box protein SKIP23-like [Mercurialis annua]
MEEPEIPCEDPNSIDWATLPANVLDIILENIVSLFDYIRFGSVCKSWLSVADHHKKSRINNYCFRKQLPLLLVPTKDGSEQFRSLYNAADTTRKMHDFQLHIPINKRCCGSSHGWLSFVEKDLSITLFNPFTQAFIRLPIFDDQFPEGYDIECELNIQMHPYDVFKLILSADPTLYPDDFTVVIINSSYLKIDYLKFGDEKWKKIEYPHRAFCMDIIWHKGLVYAVNLLSDSSRYYTEIVCFNVDSPQLKVVLTADKIQTNRKGRKYFELQNYIVESSNGNLMIVQRFMEEDEEVECSYLTKNFKVFKLVQSVDDEQKPQVAGCRLHSPSM